MNFYRGALFHIKTRAGLNSTSLTSVTTLPIIDYSPTGWGNLYTAMEEAEKLRPLNFFMTEKRSYRLICNLHQINTTSTKVRNEFIFRMGELHVVFCRLKMIGKLIGKLIDVSGLDKQVT